MDIEWNNIKNKFILDDCMNWLVKMPDNFFELAITDPPYGIGAGTSIFNREGKQTGKSKTVSGIGYKKSDFDNSIPNDKYFKELFRISKNQIVWGGNYFIDNLRNTSCFIVWDKDNGNNLYADCELAWTNFDLAVRKIKYKWHGMLQENMKNKEKRIHPTQKPIALYTWLLQNYAKKGDKILDTHVGSGSSIIACIEEGYDYLGFEIDEDYYRDANKRIEEFKSQGKLFN